MVFDLRGALLKKEERETSRLLDFEFRHRAHTARRAAEACGLDPDGIVPLIVHHDNAGAIAEIAGWSGKTPEAVGKLWSKLGAEEWAALVEEFGDPTPHRLA